MAGFFARFRTVGGPRFFQGWTDTIEWSACESWFWALRTRTECTSSRSDLACETTRGWKLRKTNELQLSFPNSQICSSVTRRSYFLQLNLLQTLGSHPGT